MHRPIPVRSVERFQRSLDRLTLSWGEKTKMQFGDLGRAVSWVK